MNFETYEKTGQTEYATLAEVVEAILSAAIARHDDVRLQHIQRRAKAPASLKTQQGDGSLRLQQLRREARGGAHSAPHTRERGASFDEAALATTLE